MREALPGSYLINLPKEKQLKLVRNKERRSPDRRLDWFGGWETAAP
jgi:hypothetical protein